MSGRDTTPNTSFLLSGVTNPFLPRSLASPSLGGKYTTAASPSSSLVETRQFTSRFLKTRQESPDRATRYSGNSNLGIRCGDR